MNVTCLAFVMFAMAGMAQGAAPGVVTEPAQFVDAYRVRLVGTVTPNAAPVTAWMEYGLTKAYGAKTVASVYAATTQLVVPVENLKEKTLYHFRLVAKAGAVTVYGADESFTTLAAFPAAIVVQPSKAFQLVKLKQSGVMLNITGSGSSAKYQWLKDKVAVPGAVYESLALPVITAQHAGVYTCRVSNPLKTVTSDPTVVAVAQLTTTGPLVVNEDSGFNLGAMVLPSGIAATYSWGIQLNPALVGIGDVAGAASPKLGVTHATPLATESYYCTIEAQGESVTVGPVAVSVRKRPVITQPSDQHFQIGQPVGFNVIIINGASLSSATGLPLGLVYNPTLRTISGRPLTSSVTPYHVTIRASNLAGAAAAVSFDITVDALDPGIATTYNGLIERQTAVAENGGFGGALRNLVVAPTGRFTAVLSLGSGATVSFVGTLDTAPGLDPSFSGVLLRKAPLSSPSLMFTIDRTTRKLTGSLQDNVNAPAAKLIAWGNRYDVAHSASAFVGLHNLWLNPPAGITAGTAPEGAGIATVTIGATGSASLVFKLADASAFSGTTTLGVSGDLPIHSMLYANHGSMHGWINIADGVSGGFNEVTGLLEWNKTGLTNPADRSYATFDLGATNSAQSLVVAGSEMRPQPGKILWGLADVVGQPNGKLTFTGGGLAASSFSPHANVSFYLNPKYTVLIHGSNLAADSLFVNGGTGAFNGTFSLYDGIPAVVRTVTFQGLIAPGKRSGKGWFILPQLPLGPANPVRSGAVGLEDAP